ncbi:hypothetical protein GCM10027037_21910 [Mucilaginibacter koreensis]
MALGFLLLFASCSSNPPLQQPGQAYLQGEWQQDSVAGQQKLLQYSLYRFKFTCDSFYVQQQSFSKVNNGADTCMAHGRWTEYMKGQYIQRNDTLRLRGFFCQANYRLKEPGGCFRTGVYDEYFKVTRKADSLLQLQSTLEVVPLQLHLTKKLDCHPQHL